jgi:hypothetical protein
MNGSEDRMFRGGAINAEYDVQIRDAKENGDVD